MLITTNINQETIFEIPEEIITSNPKQIDKTNIDFIDYNYILPTNKICKLYNIYIYGNLITNSNNEFLSQFSWIGSDTEEYFSIIQNQIQQDYDHKPKPLVLDGISLYLGATWGQRNIGHNVLDGLSRMAGYDMAGIDLKSIDHFLVHHDPEITDLLQNMGIPLNKIKNLNYRAYECKTIIMGETPGRKRQYKKIVADYFSRIIQKPVPSNDKIILNNRKHRKPINTLDLKTSASKYNYTVYNNYPTNTHFSKSSHIISPHSSTLYKLIFCKPQTNVLELVSVDHMYSYYYEVCRIFNLNYTGLLCNTVKNNSNRMYNNFMVDVDLLEEWMTTYE